MVTAKNRAISVILIITLVIGMVGIVSTDTTYAAKKRIHLKKTTVNLVVGKKYQQKLIAKNGKAIKATKVKWKTKKKSVAKIGKKGLITAVKPGTAKMTAKYKGKTYKFTVKVRKAKPQVKPQPKPQPKPQLSGLQTLYNYIDKNGYINGNGERTVSLDLNNDDSVFFVNHSGSVELIYYQDTYVSGNRTVSLVNMTLNLPSSTTTNSNIQMVFGGIYGLEAHAIVPVSTYTESTNLRYVKDSGSLPSSINIQKVCNSTFKLAMGAWDYALTLKTTGSIDLKSLGFKNY